MSGVSITVCISDTLQSDWRGDRQTLVIKPSFQAFRF